MVDFIVFNSIFFLIMFCSLDQHIDSIDSVVRVQLAQRRPRNDNNDRGGGRGGMYYYLV